MAKKGKGKGKGSGKGKGGGGKTGNARTDFLAVRINLREKALMMVENQCKDYQNTLEKLEEARDEAQAEKDMKVGKLLKKLHVSENERSGALDSLKDCVTERKRKLRDANNRRKREIEEKLGCLREAELRNAQIRRDIKKWQNFRTLGSKEQKAAVESLLNKIEDQTYNTKAMNHFIVKQIETSKSDSKKNKHDLEEGRKKQAVADAIECMPTSVHECRKTDQLKKLVDWQQLHVDEDKQYLKDIRQNMKLMTKETEELRKIKFEKPEKIGLLLDKRFFS